jgi:ACS family glucarate transporter-like MFS transporter
VLALVWWWDYRDDPAERRGVNRAELELIDADRSAVVHPTPVRWTRLLADRDLLFVTLSYFCLNYVFYLFFNWFYYYLTEVRGLPASSAGLFTGAQWMVGTLAALAGGLVCDRLSARFGARIGCRVTAIGGLLLSAPLLVAGTVAQEPLLCVTLLSLSFGSVQFTDGAYWAATMRMAGPQAQTATGVLNTGGNVVGGIGAMLVPAIAGSLGWTMAVASGAILSVVAALLWFGVRPDLTMQSRTAGAA